MSVFYLAQWSVNESKVGECDTAMQQLAAHLAESHPKLMSLRTWQQWWGPMPRRSYLWMEEFESLETMAGERHPECDELWNAVHVLADPGVFHSSVLTAPLQQDWVQR